MGVAGTAQRIVVYLHVATLGRYQEVLNEVLSSVERSPLADLACDIQVHVVGDGPVEIAGGPAQARIVRTGLPVTAFEMPTLSAIRQDAVRGRVAAALYLNCLGGRHRGRHFEIRRAWRELVAYHLVQRAPECLALVDEADVVGIEWFEAPLAHMTSNNWWAKGAYLATLPDPDAYAASVEAQDLSQYGPLWREAASRRRHAGEFWIGCGRPRAPVSRFPLRLSGLPASHLGGVAWWGVAGIEWGRLARRMAAGEPPDAAHQARVLLHRLRHTASRLKSSFRRRLPRTRAR